MNSPFLRVELKDGLGNSVLFLDERNRKNEWLIQNNVDGDRGWYKTIFVEIRGKTYRVYLTKDCQAFDLLFACEERFNLQNSRLYYTGDEVMRDKWLGNFINGASFLILEDGDEMRTPFYVKKFETLKTVKKDRVDIDIGQDEEKFKLTEVPDLNLDLQLSRSSNEEEDGNSHDKSLPSSWMPQSTLQTLPPTADEISLPSSWISQQQMSGLISDLTQPTEDTPTNDNLSFDFSALFDYSFSMEDYSESNQPPAADNTQNATLPEGQLARIPELEFPGGQLPTMADVDALANQLGEISHMLPPVPTDDDEQDLLMGFSIEHFEGMGFRMPEPPQQSDTPSQDDNNNLGARMMDNVTTTMLTHAVGDAIDRARENIVMDIKIKDDDDDDIFEDFKVIEKEKKKTTQRKKKVTIREWAKNLEDALSTPPKKEADGPGYKEEPLTPSPIKLEDRKPNKDGKKPRKLNWSVEEKVKLLTTVCLKMEQPSEGYNTDGKKNLKYVFKLMSPQADTDPEHSRLLPDFVEYYYRRGHPFDSSQSGGGMHRFLKEQCDAIGERFSAAVLRRNLKKFVQEYRRQSNGKQQKGKKPGK
jgi:hypothetical protein